jgi:cell division protein FtsB/cell division protein DivIC
VEVRLAPGKEPALPVKKMFPSWLILIVLAMFGFALMGERGALRALQSYQHKQDLEQQLSALEEQKRELREEIRLLQKDRDYWEQLARKELGMVREGELIYQFSGEDNSKKLNR